MRHGPDRVGAVEADRDAALARRGGQPCHVQQLARAVEHGRQDNEGDLLCHRRDQVVLGKRPPVP
jgi:hypothetical protein